VRREQGLRWPLAETTDATRSPGLADWTVDSHSMGLRMPSIEGLIRRRVLANWVADPQLVARLLPSPLRPKVIRDSAIVGVCLIRLEEVRLSGLPAVVGLASENAAHRIAVIWREASTGETREGVFVARRDTDSRLNRLLGGRVFPGVHHEAHFEVKDAPETIDIRVCSADGAVEVEVAGTEIDAFPSESHFRSLGEASAFFEAGRVGWSPKADPELLEGLEPEIKGWAVRPMRVTRARSSFIEDPSRFPEGAARFDHALVMRDRPHCWRTVPGTP
jgi:hypothetical protein